MIWVLDTAALFHKPLMRALVRAAAMQGPAGRMVEPILPALAYAERLRQIRHDSHDEQQWNEQLGAAGIHVEAFGAAEAARIKALAETDLVWRSHARDHLIRCHVHGRRAIVTSDRGPVWDAGPVLTPPDATAILNDLVDPRTR